MKLRCVAFSIFFIVALSITIMPMSTPPSLEDGICAVPLEGQSVTAVDTAAQMAGVSPPLFEESTSPPATGSIVIIVENALYSSVSTAVNQYRTDLNNTGYHTILYTETLTTAEELKSNLSLWYDTESILGAVMIGRLPYAQFYHPANGGFAAETFICDLFLMDLDGDWTDVSPIDGIYDTHAAIGNADIYPEIFVARIDPTCLTWGTGTANHINTYLARVHSYRTGGVQRNHRALVYIDDDWIPWAPSWSSYIGYGYPTRTNVYTPSTYTNATDWLTNRLLQDYQWGHLCAHSSPTTHYFGPGGSGEGTTTSTQIRQVPPSFNFYNLFCCSGAKWTTNDNLGVTYTFSGSYSLATIGSSKTGSMMDYDHFYGPLGENATIGEGLVEWFQHALRTDSEAGSIYLEWYYGVNIMGDPLLGIHYDTSVLSPTLTSDTHPDSQSWYKSAQPVFNWTAPPDVNAITGYFYILDQNSGTIPTSSTGTYTTNTSLVVGEDLSSGQWFFHIVAVDGAGNVGRSPAHHRVQIDASGPISTFLNPGTHQNLTTSAFQFTWTATDALSGYAYSNLQIDDIEVFNGTALSYSAASLIEGLHILNLTVYDNLGNAASSYRSFRVDLTDPAITQLTVNGPFVLGNSILAEWTVLETGSGYHYADIYLNGVFLIQTNTSQTSYPLDDLEVGNHTLQVMVYDWAGRNSSEVLSFVITNPSPNWLLAVGIAVPVLLIVIVWAVRARRR